MSTNPDAQRYSDVIRSRREATPVGPSPEPMYIPSLESPPPGKDDLQTLPLSALEPDPANHRMDLGNHSHHSEYARQVFAELVESIRAAGRVREPIKVLPRPHASAKFRIRDGHRRYFAALEAGLQTVDVLIRSLSEPEVRVDQLVANVLQERPNPYEIAVAIQQALDSGVPRDELRQSVGKSNAWLSKHLAIFKYPESIQSLIRIGRIRDLNVARELAHLDPEKLAKEIERISSGHAASAGTTHEAAATTVESEEQDTPAKRKKKAKPIQIPPAHAQHLLEQLRQLDPTLFGAIDSTQELPDRSRRAVAFRKLFEAVCQNLAARSETPPTEIAQEE